MHFRFIYSVPSEHTRAIDVLVTDNDRSRREHILLAAAGILNYVSGLVTPLAAVEWRTISVAP
jgi:hypothetical protein